MSIQFKGFLDISLIEPFGKALHQHFLSDLNKGLKMSLSPEELDIIVAPLDNKDYNIHEDANQIGAQEHKQKTIFVCPGPEGVGLLNVATFWKEG